MIERDSVSRRRRPSSGSRLRALAGCRWGRHIVRCGLFVALLAGSAPSPAQDAATKAAWSRIESAEETKTYKDEAIAGDLSDKSKAWLRDRVLPQLSDASNRSSIERVRRRIHDAFVSERSFDAAALASGNRIVLDVMSKLAMSDDTLPIVRINAMLMIGELRAKDGEPWPATLETLATATADAKLPMAVRIAAIGGLMRHAKAADFPKLAGPAVSAVVTAAFPERDRVGADWLVSRAMDILPAAIPQAPPATAAALRKVLDDASRAADVRVRAAAALGKTAVKASEVDAARTIESVRGLAVAILQADVDRAERRAFDRALGGPTAAVAMDAFAQPVDGQPFLEQLTVRRNAWRLFQLAEAVSSADGSGLARLLDESGRDAARSLAESLRGAARSLDETPDFATTNAALDSLRAVPAAAAP